MDTLTHIVLGACIGEAVAGKRLGKRALFLGAFAQSFPDIDFLGAFFFSTSDNILVHRGITHSFLFSLVAIISLARFCAWYFRKRKLGWRMWLMLVGINIFTHIFIDSFNAYGTGWFEPFSHDRISFHTIFVADPLFSLWPLIACITLTFLRQNDIRRRKVWRTGIALSCIYLIAAIISKNLVDKDVKKVIGEQQLKQENYITTPSPFNSLLWFIVIKAGDGYYAGYHSVLDKDGKMQLNFFPRNDSLLSHVGDRDEAENIIKFADDFYTFEQWHDTTVLNVLRFGQVVGWYDPHEKFVFHYFLDRPGANTLVTQRGRFEQWNKETITSLWRRICGN